MAKKKEQTAFLQRAIEGLSPDGFDEAVRIFQKYYLMHEVVDVNGTNDGGCDIKIYKNKREIKKCVQVTVRRDWENKLKKELLNADDLITKYNYSDKYDFFCSSVISESKIEEWKLYALKEYSIDLNFYEAHRLSQLQCPELRNYLYSIHDDIIIRPDQLNIDRVTKSIYDFLTVGKGSTDIKNDILNSFIISILYEKGSMAIDLLEKELEQRLQKDIPDISHTINLLKSAHRVEKDPNDPKKIKLSESEYNNAKDIFAYASLVEREFNNSFQQIISKYKIVNGSDLLERLKNLYRDYYKHDIDDEFNIAPQKKDEDIFKSFNTYLSSSITDAELRSSFVCEIKQLCEENTYLNRISASESFLSLYKSDRLEQYVKQSQKNIFIDTPVFVYLLCSTFQIDNNRDWNDQLYRSVKSLYELRTNNLKKVHLFIMQDYIGEVAGELKKAWQIAQLEDVSFFSDLGTTRNTFYNYYRFIKDNDLMEEEDEINCFGDFVETLGIGEEVFYEGNDVLLIQRLNEIVEDMEIIAVSSPFFEEFNTSKIQYEKMLSEKSKSDSAVTHDVRQVLYLLNNDRNEKEIFITWDMSLPKLRDKLMNNQYKYFPIYNPAKLSNKIALECFNIDSSAITNDIFIYADRTYGIASKVRSLLEIIAPIFGSKESKNCKTLKSLGMIRKEQFDSLEYNEVELYNKTLPIEGVFIKILDIITEKEQAKQDDKTMKKFVAFMLEPKNETYILNVVNQWSDAIKNKRSFDYKGFFENISKVKI